MPEKGHPDKEFKDHLLHNDRYFSAGQLYTVSGNGTAKILLRNPSGSEKKYFIDPQGIRSEGKMYVKKYYNPDSTSGEADTDTGVVNKNPSNNYSGDAEVKKGFSFTGGTQFSTKLLGADSNGIRAGGSNGKAANFLEESDVMIIEVENQTSNSHDVSIDIDWYEVKM